MDNEIKILVKEQLKTYRELLAVCRRQVKALQDGDKEKELDDLLKERERLFELISATDKKIKKASHSSPPDSDDVKNLEVVLKEIVELDNEIGRMLEWQKSSLAEQMKRMNRGVVAVKGYDRGKTGGSGKFISRKG